MGCNSKKHMDSAKNSLEEELMFVDAIG